MPIVYKRQNLLSNTTCTPRHDKENHLYENNQREITLVKCKIGLWFLSSAFPLIFIYVCTKFNLNPFCTFQDVARTSKHYKTKWLRGDNSVSSAVHFLGLPSIYKPSFISIPFVLSKIWAGQASIMKKTFKRK